MKVNEIPANQILVKSKLPASDYVANPYVGCTHNCRYCYASFMKRFTGHDEPWGSFLDIKQFTSRSIPRNLSGKTVLLSSVTDPYNAYEVKFHKSREVLQLLKDSGANVEILSKSDLMLRDIDLLKQIPNLKVGISLCTLDDNFRRDMESGAPSVSRRLTALKKLHDAGISTYLFISPIFPYITDIEEIVATVYGTVDKICFENLNLRGSAKAEILGYINTVYPDLSDKYRDIYIRGDMSYWEKLEGEITRLSALYDVPFVNFFYHSKIKKS